VNPVTLHFLREEVMRYFKYIVGNDIVIWVHDNGREKCISRDDAKFGITAEGWQPIGSKGSIPQLSKEFPNLWIEMTEEDAFMELL
jgi:hypothetical protein